MYTSILSRRLNLYINIFDTIAEEQAGFREGYSTIDNAFILNSVIQKQLSKKGRKLYVAFVDSEKAFDSVNRHKLWSVLIRCGIRGKLFKALQSIYKNVKACVVTKDGHTDTFNCPNGLKQGCLGSTTLFILYINDLIEQVNSSGLPGIQLFPDYTQVLSLLFADDLGLLADTATGLQRLLNLLSEFCVEKGLKCNVKKTKILVFKNGGKLSRNEKWIYNDRPIEIVKCFSYVGLNFTQTNSLFIMAKDQALKGKRVLIPILNKLYQYGQLPKNIYFNIFDTKVTPTTLWRRNLGVTKARIY